MKVKRAFKREMNLIVDSANSPGNTLTGNVARKAFAHPIKFAQIIGVSPMLVSNFFVIWQTLASKHLIRVEHFERLCAETLELYMSEVGWFNLPPTLHKILVHGREIIEASPVPIGLTSEESSESNNKFIRKYLLHHTRKTSQLDTMTDLVHRLLAVSDPLLIAKSFKGKKDKSRSLTSEMTELLHIPENENIEESSDKETDSDDD